MAENKNINLDDALEKLKNMEKNLKTAEDNSLVWLTFPYSPHNLEIIKKSLKLMGWDESDYNLNYDENLIFLEKDVFEI
ncbi:MAG: hypothetical protein QME14_08800 [Methanobacteriaceae archaeon]|nr:hypothetical protein [Methanobacteriaceae archaeon]